MGGSAVARVGGAGGGPLERLHLIADVVAAFFARETLYRSLIRQIQGGPAIVTPALDSFTADVYGRYDSAMSLLAQVIEGGQARGEIRDGSSAALAHLTAILINEFALTETPISATTFHAVLDGALRR